MKGLSTSFLSYWLPVEAPNQSSHSESKMNKEDDDDNGDTEQQMSRC